MSSNVIAPVVSSYSFNGMNIRTVVREDGEILFVLKDVAEILGYAKTQNLNDLLSEQLGDGHVFAVTIPDSLGRMQTTGCTNETGLYTAISASKKPDAIPFRKWVNGEVLPSIRKTGSYNSPNAKQEHWSTNQVDGKLLVSLTLADFTFRTLGYSNVSKLKTIRRIHKSYGVDDTVLEPYVIDAPSDSTGLSSEPVDSLTRILKQENSKISIQKANKILLKIGILKEQTRQSRKDPSGVKSYKVVTEKGSVYGRNDVSDQNPNETQPHWYLCKAKELVKLIEENA